MPARPDLPTDDLYARLEVPADATFEAIEIAWRALLKRHHPDIAGAGGLEVAKRINVAHDWLSDQGMRERYDRERGLRSARRSVRDAWHPRSAPAPAPPRRRSGDPAETLRRFVERVGVLSRDELDRLAMAEGPPIAFVASIRRFLAADRVAAVDAAEAAIAAGLRREDWRNPAVRDAVLGAAHEIVLRDFLDEHLAEPFRGRVRERLTRGWEAALGQPRYGPNGAAVRRLIDRAALLTDDEARRLVRAAGRGRLGAEPWPRGIDPDEDEVFRVSSALAGRDAAAAPALAGLDRTTASRARRLLRRTAHATVLRHAFSADEFARLVGPWHEATGDPGTGRAGGPSVDPTIRRR